jgi:hypothetical protein
MGYRREGESHYNREVAGASSCQRLLSDAVCIPTRLAGGCGIGCGTSGIPERELIGLWRIKRLERLRRAENARYANREMALMSPVVAVVVVPVSHSPSYGVRLPCHAVEFSMTADVAGAMECRFAFEPLRRATQLS